jgi:cytochrome c peroxidase
MKPFSLCFVFAYAIVSGGAPVLAAGASHTQPESPSHAERALDEQLSALLHGAGFTGRVESTLEARLGRPVDRNLADLGRLIFFDRIPSLHSDNACAGCHSPTNGFGDTQPMAIGIQSNGIVGPHRDGPRNQRRTPMAANTAFFPKLMWNGRFASLSGDPFDGSAGFEFPAPEGTTKFPPNDPIVRQLLVAQAHIPPTELVEVAGFTGTKGTLDPRFDVFDDGLGSPVPPPDGSGYRNEPIRQAVLARFNASPTYRALFAGLFPQVAAGGPIDFTMLGRAIAEFEFTLVFADAPIDRFARGDARAMNASEKRGAVLFFGSAGCVSCHAVAGPANEMFSDFANHRIAVPQVAPAFGPGLGNVVFDGAGEDEDFGREQISGDSADRYAFRTSPLRNVALQPAFFHDGAFTRLEDAVQHHLDVFGSARGYDPKKAGVDRDLLHVAPVEPLLVDVDPLLRTPLRLTAGEVRDLVAFVRNGLLDPRAAPARLCALVPASLPSGMPPLRFEGCPQGTR